MLQLFSLLFDVVSEIAQNSFLNAILYYQYDTKILNQLKDIKLKVKREFCRNLIVDDDGISTHNSRKLNKFEKNYSPKKPSLFSW